MNEKKSTWGGSRPGSGRKTDSPVRGTKMLSFRVDIDLIEYLDSQDNKGRFINKLIREQMLKDQSV